MRGGERLDRVSAESSHEAEDAETSGVRLLLTSPDASEDKDKEVWCTPEEVLAMLLAGVKVGSATIIMQARDVWDPCSLTLCKVAV